MSTYTVTADQARGSWSVLQDGTVIDMGFREAGARREARRLSLNERAEAMLALLVESRNERLMWRVDDAVKADWCTRRDALIKQITGESK